MSYDFVSLHPPYRQIFDCNISSGKLAGYVNYVYNTIRLFLRSRGFDKWNKLQWKTSAM